ncbi:MAG: hypothetical protein K2K25_04580 [Muribaculaceae bacterium]|nr:hypothetical protein [Muribaculaceae bacterium]
MKKLIFVMIGVCLTTGLSWGQETLPSRDGTNASSASQSVSLRETAQVNPSDLNELPYISYGTTPTIIYIQNETINGPKTYSGSKIKVGSAVTSTKTQGPVMFNSGKITLSASEIQINPNTTISGFTQFKAEIK